MGVDFRKNFAFVDLSAATCVERLDEYEFFIRADLAQAQAHVVALALLEIGSSLPSRDRFEVTIDVDGEAASASDSSEDSRNRISQLFDLGSTTIAEVGFRIIIRKQLRDYKLSVYDIDAFGEYLVNQPLKQVLDAIAARLDGHIKFVCTGLLKPGGSTTLQFIPEDYTGPAKAFLSPATRERTISLFKETSFSASLPATLVPLDFQLDDYLDLPKIDEFFNRASAVLSAAYLCNNLEIESDGSITYRLAGYKVLEEKRSSQLLLADAQNVLSKIANWAYDAGGSTDKVGLARNVISLHVSTLPKLASQSHVLNAILSNYQIYLKDNISAYLDVRNRMAELLLEWTAKTNSLVESLLDAIRNGILVIFTFLLTVVVVNGLKDTSAKLIFSAEYLFIVLVIAVLCSIWIHFACIDIKKRFDSAVNITRQLLLDSYRSILIEDEVNQHTKATFEANKAHLNTQIKIYQRLWYIVSIILVLAFATGYFVIYHLPNFHLSKTHWNSTPSITKNSPEVLQKNKSERNVDLPAAPSSIVKTQQKPLSHATSNHRRKEAPGQSPAQ